MPLTFQPPPDPEPHVNVLLYGPPKSGKTAGACSAPEPVVLLNADLPNASRYAHSRREILELQFEGFETLVDVVRALGDGTLDAGTVVVDPIGELHRHLLEEASNRAVRPTLNQYGDVGVHLERFCRALCEAPVNTVLVCHEQPVKDEASGVIERLPWTGTTNPALGHKLMGMVDVVGYCGLSERDDGELEYVAQLVNGGGRRGGDRFAVLGLARTLDLSEWFALAATQTEKETA